MLRRFRHLLWLGWLVAIANLAVAAEPVASGSAPNRAANRNLLVLGDSLAAGFGVDPSEAYPALLQEHIRRASLPFKVINAGVSGDTTAGGLRRIDWLMKQPVDVLILELGGNDGLRGLPVAAMRTNLQGIITKAKSRNPQLRVVVAGMQMPPNMGAEFTAAFRDVFPEIAKANGAALVPFLLDGVGGVPDLNLPDMVHPNPKGHHVVASNVWKVLEPVLRELAGSNAKTP